MHPQTVTSTVVAAGLAVSAAAQSSTSAQVESSSATRSTAVPEITPGPDWKMSRHCLSEVISKVFIDKQDPQGALGDFVSSSKLYESVNIPTSECELLTKIPATLHGEYFSFQSSRSEWWKSHRSEFTKWASTCSGSPNTGWADIVTPYQSHSAFLDTYSPASATTCEGVTSIAGAQETSGYEGTATRQTMAAGAALAAAAGAYAAAVAI